LNGGRVRQSGPVQDVFARPADATVARIVGVETVEGARVLSLADGVASVLVGETRIVASAPGTPTSEPLSVCIRAEEVSLDGSSATPTEPMNRLPGRVLGLSCEGWVWRVSLDCGFPLVALVSGQALRAAPVREGDRITVTVAASAVRLVPG